MDDNGDRFLRLLHQISQRANSDHVKTAKFLLRSKITRKQMEQCNDMRDLFDKLITKGYIASDNIEILKDLTTQVFHDCDIDKMLQLYERGEKSGPTSSFAHRTSSDTMSSTMSQPSLRSKRSAAINELQIPAKFKEIFNYTANHLGEDWKILAGLMGLLDKDIENITRQSQGLYAQSLSTMHIWFNNQERASTREFKRLLRRIPRNDIADDLQEQMPKH